MLVDYNALCEEIGTDAEATDLGLPATARQVEAIPDAKEKLKEVIRIATANRPRRRRRAISLGELYEPLAKRLDIELLKQVPAFQVFVTDLTATLKQLNLL
jgi:hypothetical protein